MIKRLSLHNPTDATAQQDVPDRTEPEVELLVAYLDGELDAENVRQVENRLSIEPDLREKMTSLEQTWNLLDELETVPANKEIVRSTMEVVTLTIEKELSENEQQLERYRWLDLAVLAAILLMFGIIGFQLSLLAGIQGKKQLINDIPIIENMNKYKEIGSFDFLKALSDQQVFDPPSEDDMIPEIDSFVLEKETQP